MKPWNKSRAERLREQIHVHHYLYTGRQQAERNEHRARRGVAVGTLVGLVLWVIICCLLVMMMSGCGPTRENAKATIQADQAVEGAGRRLTDRELLDAIAALPPEQRAVIERAVRDVIALLGGARVSLAPAIALLSQGERIQVDTTADQAARDPATFVAATNRQAGRAEAEAERYLANARLVGFLYEFGKQVAGDWVSVALLSLGGGTGVVAAIAKVVQSFGRYRTALTKATAYGDDMERAETNQDVQRVKERHAAAQTDAGVRTLIQKARAKPVKALA